MNCADCWCKVSVSGDHNGNVKLWRKAHKVNHKLNVEVGLEATVAILANILAHNLVVVAIQEVMERLLILVIWIESGVRIGAN